MKNIIHMIVTLSLVSALAAGALALGNRATRDGIKKQAKLKAARAVKKIYPDCIKPSEKVVKNKSGNDIKVFECSKGRRCFIFSSKDDNNVSRPYSGTIKMMIGVSSNGTVDGIQIIQQSETPGLGARISEESFVKKFKGVSLSSKLKVKKDDPSGAVDGISGATISSRAVTSMVKCALEFNRDILSKGSPSPRKKIGLSKLSKLKNSAIKAKKLKDFRKKYPNKKRKYPLPKSKKEVRMHEGGGKK
ncbi:MAG: RnfABCDGE type electron transport complex subunit G [Deltaproteobacteria bacterium]|nr:RnfABCDGE type electron transport complex subunit G [Deltaproteobacteria bacterium]